MPTTRVLTPTRRARSFTRALTLLAAVAVVVAASLWPASSEAQSTPAPGPRLVVVHKNGGRLLIVDPATGQIVGSAPTGTDPHEVAVSPDNRTAYVTNYGPPGLPGTTLSVIDLGAQTEARRVALNNLQRPHGVAEVDGKIYFTAERANAVGRFNPATGEVDKTFDTAHDDRLVLKHAHAINGDDAHADEGDCLRARRPPLLSARPAPPARAAAPKQPAKASTKESAARAVNEMLCGLIVSEHSCRKKLLED